MVLKKCVICKTEFNTKYNQKTCSKICSKALSESYYERNREKIIKQNEKWAKKNPKKFLASQKKYYDKNKDKILPKARIRAKERQRMIRKEYQRHRAWIIQQLGGKCVECGYNRCIHAIEIHHIDETKKPKGWNSQNKSYRDLFYKWYKLGFIPENKKKNMILYCSNCHKEHHYCSTD